MHPSPLRVLIADDSDAYRSGIARAIRAHPELDLVGEVDGGAAALAAILDLQPDVAILDVRMPAIDGLEVAARVRAAQPTPPTRFVLLSAYVDAPALELAREAGVEACVSKAATRRDICAEAIRVGRG